MNWDWNRLRPQTQSGPFSDSIGKCFQLHVLNFPLRSDSIRQCPFLFGVNVMSDLNCKGEIADLNETQSDYWRGGIPDIETQSGQPHLHSTFFQDSICIQLQIRTELNSCTSGTQFRLLGLLIMSRK